MLDGSTAVIFGTSGKLKYCTKLRKVHSLLTYVQREEKGSRTGARFQFHGREAYYEVSRAYRVIQQMVKAGYLKMEEPMVSPLPLGQLLALLGVLRSSESADFLALGSFEVICTRYSWGRRGGRGGARGPGAPGGGAGRGAM